MGGHLFFDIDGITGTATDAKHVNCIEIKNFSSTVTNREDTLRDEGEEMEGPDIPEISFKKLADKTSPEIVYAACTGKPIGNGTIKFCRPTGKLTSSNGLEEFMRIELKTVTIKEYQLEGGDSYPEETIKIGFRSIKWEYDGTQGKASKEWTLHAE